MNGTSFGGIDPFSILFVYNKCISSFTHKKKMKEDRKK